jgi:hypothetical protein
MDGRRNFQRVKFWQESAKNERQQAEVADIAKHTSKKRWQA